MPKDNDNLSKTGIFVYPQVCGVSVSGPAPVLQIRHFLPIFVIYKREVLHA